MIKEKIIEKIAEEMYDSFGINVDKFGIRLALEHDLAANNNRDLIDAEVFSLVEASNGEENASFELIKLYPNLFSELKECF